MKLSIELKTIIPLFLGLQCSHGIVHVYLAAFVTDESFVASVPSLPLHAPLAIGFPAFATQSEFSPYLSQPPDVNSALLISASEIFVSRSELT